MERTVTLEPLIAKNWRAALNVRVSDEQLPYVADHQPIALVILSKAQVGEGGGEWEPLGIFAGQKMVGVVGLTHRGQQSFMENLAIDYPSQRQGFGRAAVELACAWCARRGSAELFLTVHDDNTGAQQLYTAVGFAPTGRRPFGDPEWRYRLSPDSGPHRNPCGSESRHS